MINFNEDFSAAENSGRRIEPVAWTNSAICRPSRSVRPPMTGVPVLAASLGSKASMSKLKCNGKSPLQWEGRKFEESMDKTRLKTKYNCKRSPLCNMASAACLSDRSACLPVFLRRKIHSLWINSGQSLLQALLDANFIHHLHGPVLDVEFLHNKPQIQKKSWNISKKSWKKISKKIQKKFQKIFFFKLKRISKFFLKIKNFFYKKHFQKVRKKIQRKKEKKVRNLFRWPWKKGQKQRFSPTFHRDPGNAVQCTRYDLPLNYEGKSRKESGEVKRIYEKKWVMENRMNKVKLLDRMSVKVYHGFSHSNPGKSCGIEGSISCRRNDTGQPWRLPVAVVCGVLISPWASIHSTASGACNSSDVVGACPGTIGKWRRAAACPKMLPIAAAWSPPNIMGIPCSLMINSVFSAIWNSKNPPINQSINQTWMCQSSIQSINQTRDHNIKSINQFIPAYIHWPQYGSTWLSSIHHPTRPPGSPHRHNRSL